MQPSHIAPPSHRADFAAPLRRERACSLEREWGQLHVDRFELERAASPSTLATVRACVDLGELLPADVEVRLTIEGGPDPSLPDRSTDRMWTAQSYQNGRFAFEAHVPDATVAAARRMTVRVVPARAGGEPHPPAELLPTLELDLAPPRDAESTTTGS